MKQVIICILLAFMVLSCKKPAVYLETPSIDDVAKLDITALRDKEAVFYSFTYKDKGINFFVLKINNNVQSFFDACTKCYPKKLGYRQDKDTLVCRACNIRYQIDSLKGIGTCYPILLEGRIEGNNYLIKKEKIIEGEKYF